MATPDKPELSNGYTRIASAILENLATVRLSGREWNVLMVILRQTYGWNRKEARITGTEFVEFTGLLATHVYSALRSLKKKGIVNISKRRDATAYGFQKYFTQWDGVLRTQPHRPKELVTENGHKDTDRKRSLRQTENGHSLTI